MCSRLVFSAPSGSSNFFAYSSSYYGRTSKTEKSRIYVSRPNTLPPRQLLDSSMLLVCAEGMPSLAYQHCGTQLLVIRLLDKFQWHGIHRRRTLNLLGLSLRIPLIARRRNDPHIQIHFRGDLSACVFLSGKNPEKCRQTIYVRPCANIFRI